MKKNRLDARDRILEAAEAVARDVGAANLTLDAVAAAAQVSKGGLLYHFATKEALLRGMVDHHLDERRAHVERAQAAHGAGLGGYLKASLEAQLHAGAKKTPESSRSFLAAAANFPGVLERPRQEVREHFERLRADPARFEQAALVALAMDGLHFLEMLGLSPFGTEERARLLEAMRRAADAL